MGCDVGEDMWHHLRAKAQWGNALALPASGKSALARGHEDAMLSHWVRYGAFAKPAQPPGLWRHGTLADVREGSLLFSDPFAYVMERQYLFKAVILVTEKTEEGLIIGVILNRPANWCDLLSPDGISGVLGHFGGPLGIAPGRKMALCGVHCRADWAKRGNYEAIGPAGFYRMSPRAAFSHGASPHFMAGEGALFVRGFLAWRTRDLEEDLSAGRLFAAAPRSRAAAVVRRRLGDEGSGRARNFDERVWETGVAALGPELQTVARPPPFSRREEAYALGEVALRAWNSRMQEAEL
jgi:hypothetical protein